ncbi:BPSS1780 family membrane protein [Luteimonas sp. MJ293]|uniref:BPSS1780 family membrane protein n=1 Tax=Luteimonas sp. MJ146 TaxID=3129240 RepID=UPI0031B9DD1A
MGNANRVRAGAGAEWLLGGFGLLKKAPLALGLVGLVFAIISVLPLLFMGAGPLLSMLAQLALVLLTPILLGGLIYAVREVDQGREAHPSHLLQAFREGRAVSLVAQLVPQMLAGLLAIVLLAVMVGPTALQNIVVAMEQTQGQNPDPTLFDGFPMGRFALWFLGAIVIGIVTYMFTFLFQAQVMFEGARPFAAMKRSFQACMANIGAFLVFMVLLLIVAVAILIGAQIVGLILGIFGGQVVAAVGAQLLMMTVLMPVLMGAVYLAWRQLLGGQAVAGTTPQATGIEL